MKKFLTLFTALILTVSFSAQAAPVGNGYGNACCVPAVNSFCWMNYSAPLNNPCGCPQTPYPGFIC